MAKICTFCIYVLLTNCITCILSEEEATAITTEFNEDEESTIITSTAIRPTAEKLISYLHVPSITAFRQKARPLRLPRPRRKFKSPRPIYGPPKYIYADPITFYKSKPHKYYESKRPGSTNYDVESFVKDFESDFGIKKLPISSYDQDSIKLHLYDNLQKKKKSENVKIKTEYIDLDEHPHEQYSNFENISPVVSSYGEEDPQQDLFGIQQANGEYLYEHQNNEQFKNQNPSKYEEPPSATLVEDTYSISNSQYQNADQNVRNQSVSYHNSGNYFAEPPTSVHITYSPTYDISAVPPSTSYGVPIQPAYKPHQIHGEDTSHFAEPPEYNNSPSGNNFQLFADQPLNESNFPLNEKRFHGYDYPKSSYEVPLYEAIPFEKSGDFLNDNYPPNIYNTNPETEASQSKLSSNKIEITLKRYPNEKEAIEQHLSAHANNFQTNYELSLDPSSKYRPIISQSNIPSTTISSFLQPKRKHNRGQTHNLDTDDLRYAFEKNASNTISYPEIDETTTPSNYFLLASKNRDSLKINEPSWEPTKLTSRHKINRIHRQTTNGSNSEPKPVVVSIQKSISHSYSDGRGLPQSQDYYTRSAGTQRH